MTAEKLTDKAPEPEWKARYTQIGRALREARLAQGMSETDLARRIGCSSAAVEHWENAGRRISIETLERVAWILDREIGYFLDTTVERTPPALWESAYAPGLIGLVAQEIRALATCGFPVRPRHNPSGAVVSYTHLHRLFPRLIKAAWDFPVEIHFDRDLGGIEEESDLVDLLSTHFREELSR